MLHAEETRHPNLNIEVPSVHWKADWEAFLEGGLSELRIGNFSLSKSDLKSCLEEDITSMNMQDLRRRASLLKKLIFCSKQDLEDLDKMKGLWADKPAFWPDDIFHGDPSNASYFDGKRRKPRKEELDQMMWYLTCCLKVALPRLLGNHNQKDLITMILKLFEQPQQNEQPQHCHMVNELETLFMEPTSQLTDAAKREMEILKHEFLVILESFICRHRYDLAHDLADDLVHHLNERKIKVKKVKGHVDGININLREPDNYSQRMETNQDYTIQVDDEHMNEEWTDAQEPMELIPVIPSVVEDMEQQTHAPDEDMEELSSAHVSPDALTLLRVPLNRDPMWSSTNANVRGDNLQVSINQDDVNLQRVYDPPMADAQELREPDQAIPPVVEDMEEEGIDPFPNLPPECLMPQMDDILNGDDMFSITKHLPTSCEFGTEWDDKTGL